MDYPERIIRAPEGFPVEELYWAQEDVGTYGHYNSESDCDGPIGDWIASHSKLIQSIKKKRICVQAGGALGLYPLLLSVMFDEVHTFEPYEVSLHFLRKNVSTRDNVFVYPAALGSKEQDVSIEVPVPANLGANKVVEKPGGIRMMTLDSLNLENVDLIMYDLEGYEYQALLGSVDTIMRCDPVIFVERPSWDAQRLLESLGYEHWIKSALDTVFLK